MKSMGKRFGHFRKGIKMDNKHMKKMLNIISYHEKMQIKAIMRYHYTSIRMAKIKKIESSFKYW